MDDLEKTCKPATRDEFHWGVFFAHPLKKVQSRASEILKTSISVNFCVNMDSTLMRPYPIYLCCQISMFFLMDPVLLMIFRDFHEKSYGYRCISTFKP